MKKSKEISVKCEFRIQTLRFLALRTVRTVRSGTRFSYELHHFSGDSRFREK